MTIPTYGKLEIGEGLATIGQNLMRMIKPDFEQAALISDQIKANPQVAQQFADALYLGNPLPPMHRDAFDVIRQLSPSTAARVENVHRAVLRPDALSNPDLANIAPEDIETMRNIQLFGGAGFAAEKRAESSRLATEQRAATAAAQLSARTQQANERLTARAREFEQTMGYKNRYLDAMIAWHNQSDETKRAIAGAANGVRMSIMNSNNANQLEAEAFRLANSVPEIDINQARQYIQTGTDPTGGKIAAGLLANRSEQVANTVSRIQSNINTNIGFLTSPNATADSRSLAINNINQGLQRINEEYAARGMQSPLPGNIRVVGRDRFLRADQIMVTNGTTSIPLSQMYDVSSQLGSGTGTRTTPAPSSTPAPATPAPAAEPTSTVVPGATPTSRTTLDRTKVTSTAARNVVDVINRGQGTLAGALASPNVSAATKVELRRAYPQAR